MLRNLSIRAKLLALLAVPLLLLLGTSAALNTRIVQESRETGALAEYAKSAEVTTSAITTLQRERLLTVQWLLDDFPSTKLQLDQARAAQTQATGAAYAAARASGVPLTEGVAGAVAARIGSIAQQELPAVRAQVDARQISPYQAMERYNEFTETITDLPLAIADDSDNRELAVLLKNFGLTQHLADEVTHEQVAGVLVIRGSDVELATEELRDASLEQELYAKQLRTSESEEELQELDDALAANAGAQGDVYEARKIFSRTAGATGTVALGTWMNASDTMIEVYSTKAADSARELAEEASDAQRAADLTWWVFTTVNVLVMAGVTVLAVLMARGIARRLSRLATAATEVRDELPRMVERMQTPGEGPGVEIVPLDDSSGDEVGQLSRVINDLNSTTVRIAGEQAALRASIAEMFVNVARRDQTLLARQLAFLDQLERTEENPDTLEDLFTLDHLATRMRRNAESLLVLAGINTGRRLRRPLPLSDVIRTAAGEIEHYDRVDLALQVDPPVVGHLALSLAHMIAELLENATNFSDPSSRVVVSTSETATGVQVVIVDQGLGMSEEELTSALERITGARASEVVGAQRLGFFVVGRLAGRLEVEVGISAVEGKGTTVTLDLGPSLFVPGSVAAVEAPAATAGELPAAEQPQASTVPAPAVPDEVVRSVQEIAPEPAPQPQRPAASTPLPTRRPLPTRAGGATPAPAAPKAQSLPEVPLMPAVEVPLPVDTAWAPESVQPAGDAPKAMPRRRKAGEVPAAAAPAAAQDILPKRGGGRGRPRRESPVPPRTAAEALWTSRSRTEAPAAEAPAAVPAAEVPAPAPAPAPVVVPAQGGGLPQRRRAQAAPVAEAPVAEVPVAEAPVAEVPLAPAPVRPAVDGLPKRTSLAADALSAMAESASFRPTMGGGSQPLVRRQAGATPAAAKPAPSRPAAAARQRRAPADVRSMLSGFQAGVSRGRASADTGDTPGAEGGADARSDA